MNTIVKHFVFTSELPHKTVRGRFYIALNTLNENQYIRIGRVSGSYPYIRHVVAALQAANLPDAIYPKHFNRYDYAIDVYSGMSGKKDFVIRSLDDVHLGVMPVIGRLHVSMSGRITERVAMPLWALLSLLDFVYVNDTESCFVQRKRQGKGKARYETWQDAFA